MSLKSLSPQELRVWQAFKHMREDVFDRVARDITAETGLSVPEFSVLSRLDDAPGRKLRQQALGESIGWDKSRVSHQLTRMEQRGLVERREAEERGVVVGITKLGRQRIAAARPIHATAVRRHLIERLTAKQRETILEIALDLAVETAEQS